MKGALALLLCVWLVTTGIMAQSCVQQQTVLTPQNQALPQGKRVSESVTLTTADNVPVVGASIFMDFNFEDVQQQGITATTDSNGVATGLFNLGFDTPYTFTFTYNGGPCFAASFNSIELDTTSLAITATSFQSSTASTLTATSLTASCGVPASVTIIITRLYGTAGPVPFQPMTVNVGGFICSGLSTSSDPSQYTCSFTPSAGQTGNTVTASFPSGTTFVGSSASIAYVVTGVALTTVSDPVVSVDPNTCGTLSVSSTFSGGTSVLGQSIRFTITPPSGPAVSLIGITDASGVATVTLNSAVPGGLYLVQSGVVAAGCVGGASSLVVTGTNCVDSCSTSPCLNAGTCSNSVTGYTCTCPPNWGDATCSTCTSGYSGAICQCANPSLTVPTLSPAILTTQPLTGCTQIIATALLKSGTTPVPNVPIDFTIHYPFSSNALSLSGNTNAQGVATVTIPSIEFGGYYTVDVSSRETGCYAIAHTTNIPTLNCGNPACHTVIIPTVVTVSQSPNPALVGSTVTITGTLTTADGVPIVGELLFVYALRADGTAISLTGSIATDVNGIVTRIITLPTVDSQMYVSYNQPTCYLSSSVQQLIVADPHVPTRLQISTSSGATSTGSLTADNQVITTTCGTAATLRVQLLNSATGGGIAGKSTTVTIGPFVSTALTAVSGRIFAYTSNSLVTGQRIVATFAGDATAFPSIRNISLVVNGGTVTTLSTPIITSIDSATCGSLSISSTVSGGTPVSGRVVTFTISTPSGPVIQSATTNTAGVASIALPSAVSGGAYTAVASFASSGCLLSSTSSTGSFTNCVNFCAPNQCQNAGACVNSGTGFSCNCAAGYSGPTCAVNIDDCSPNPCQNGAVCTDGVNQFSCACASGWTGATCSIDIDECATNNGGCTVFGAVCTNLPGSFSCDNCAGAPCINGATCTSNGITYSCQCLPGYSGAECQVNIDECASTPCQYNGVCVDQVNGYVCSCAAGYTGTNCETEINECLPLVGTACQNGATCTDGVNSFTCTCTGDYQGIQCEVPVDHCLLSNPCQNGGACVGGLGPIPISCSCLAGYSGSLCEVDIDECSPSQCLNGALCIDHVNAFSCTCAAGYNGPLCATDIDECASSPCAANAACVDHVDGFTCTCGAGYSGTFCDVNIDDCTPNPCAHGVCTDLVNAFSCACDAGYSGPTCSIDIDDCSPNPCLSGGVCADLVAGFSCTCAAGYSGPTCSVNIDDCSPNPCQNGGVCTDLVAAYSCSCASGYSGDQCQVNIDDCAPSPCAHGVCTDLVAGFSCACDVGYSGDSCDVNIDDCLPNPCQHSGVCTDLINGFSCACAAGYAGPSCAVNIDDCTPNPCVHGACLDLVAGYSCTCTAGYSGAQCDVDINQCASNPCGSHGTCLDAVNGFSCTCTSDYSGLFCNVPITDCTPANGCTDVNECLTANGGCAPGVVCTNTAGSRLCGACLRGYSGDGITCTDINECAATNGGCFPSVTCTNSPGGFSCGACPTGYTGNGISCIDVNECATGNGGCSSLVGCSNTAGSRVCGACPTGFFGDGVTCTDVNECATGNGGCVTTCANTDGSRTCGPCPSGFTGNGIVCNDVNECATANGGCSTLASCSNTPGSRTCGACPSGYSGDGVVCNDVNECLVGNGGCSPLVLCSNTLGGRTCAACPSGYTGNGVTCTDINECATSNGGCDVHATCTNIVGGPRTCACVPGYTGSGLSGQCALTNACASVPCGVGYVCAVSGNSAGYTCTDINECRTSNGGCVGVAVCSNTPGSRTCNCPSGYVGDGNNGCVLPNPCLTANGGCPLGTTCSVQSNTGNGNNGNGNGNNKPKIKCTDVNECASNPCLHGATCYNGNNRFDCLCAPEWMGATCSIPSVCPADSHGNVCGGQGYGRCISGVCKCCNGWEGHTCIAPERALGICEFEMTHYQQFSEPQLVDFASDSGCSRSQVSVVSELPAAQCHRDHQDDENEHPDHDSNDNQHAIDHANGVPHSDGHDHHDDSANDPYYRSRITYLGNTLQCILWKFNFQRTYANGIKSNIGVGDVRSTDENGQTTVVVYGQNKSTLVLGLTQTQVIGIGAGVFAFVLLFAAIIYRRRRQNLGSKAAGLSISTDPVHVAPGNSVPDTPGSQMDSRLSTVELTSSTHASV